MGSVAALAARRRSVHALFFQFLLSAARLGGTETEVSCGVVERFRSSPGVTSEALRHRRPEDPQS